MYRVLRQMYNLNKVPITKYSRNLSITKINMNKDDTVIYTQNEEWHYHTDEYIKIGITKKAIEQLSDVVYLDFTFEENETIDANDEIVTIESVKATEGVSINFNCEIIENNTKLAENLDTLNNDPENVDTSYLVKVKKI